MAAFAELLATRALGTLYSSNTALFYDDGCSLVMNGSLLVQAEVFVDLAIKF